MKRLRVFLLSLRLMVPGISIIGMILMGVYPVRLFPRTAGDYALLQHYWEYPEPKPEYLIETHLYTNEYGNFRELCFELNEPSLWNKGDIQFDNDIFKAVQKSLIVKVDKVALTDLGMGEGGAMFNGSDGRFGGFIEVCSELKNFSPGLHLASYEFLDTQGKQYQHTWAFEISQ